MNYGGTATGARRYFLQKHQRVRCTSRELHAMLMHLPKEFPARGIITTQSGEINGELAARTASQSILPSYPNLLHAIASKPSR